MELVALEARLQRLFALKCNVVERGCQRVPSGARGGFRAHDMRLGPHSHGAPAKWPVHEADFDLDRRPRLNPLGAEKEDSAGADIGRSQRLPHVLPLAGDAVHAQRQAELGACVGAPFFRRAHGMGRNARDALGLGSRGPRRRIDHRGRRSGPTILLRRQSPRLGSDWSMSL